jgi:Holliday junction resolvase-like predicted endonuclease
MNLIDKIDEYLVKRETRERKSYYPSEVSKCLRQLYYRWERTPESDPIKPGAFWKMRMGDKAHEMIVEYLTSAGMEIVAETSFTRDVNLKYPVSGRIDIIFVDDDRTLAGCEVKTSYGAGIRAIRREGYPKKQDIEQVIVYMGCTDIKRFYLLYLGRDDGYRTQFLIEQENGVLCCDGKPVHTTFSKLVNRFWLLEAAVRDKIIPAREFNVAIKDGVIREKYQKDKIEYKSDWQCLYCAYMNHCWQDKLQGGE